TKGRRRTVPWRAQPAGAPERGEGGGAAPRHGDRRTARAGDRGRSVRDDRSWLHLLHRLDADDGKTRGDDDRDPAHQSKARAGQRRIVCEDKAQFRLVLALVPQGVKRRRYLLEIKGNTVRLVRLGGTLDHPGPAGEFA